FEAKVWQNDEDVENPKKLTPADWRRCEARLVKLLEKIRESRISRETEERLNARFEEIEKQRVSLLKAQTDPVSRIIFPSRQAFFKIEEVKPFWQQDTTFDEQRWNQVLDEIEAHIVSTRKGLVQACYDAVMSFLG
ncbi:hypothetical protein JCM5350_001982, partial [Sporobolomyces pararoseus]